MTASNNLALDYEPEVGSSASAQGFWHSGYERSSVGNTTVVSYTAFFSPLSASAKEFISKVKAFALLNENWDSYGAVPPSSEIVDQAISLIKKADGNLLPLYFVAPGPNGEIAVEFKKNNREAAIYIHADGSTELLLHEGNDYILEGTLEEHYKNLLSFING
jgi:hypothetical protein